MRRLAWTFVIVAAVTACGDGRGPSRETRSVTQVETVEGGDQGFSLEPQQEPSATSREPQVTPASSDRSTIVADGNEFACTPTAVWDGDGPIWCEEGPKVRLAGIAAREMDGTCSPGHPCPDASAEEARDQLVRLLGGPKGILPTGHVRVISPTMTCLSEGHARGSRTAAWCRTPTGVDLNCAMIESGVAARWEKYDPEDRCRS